MAEFEASLDAKASEKQIPVNVSEVWKRLLKSDPTV